MISNNQRITLDATVIARQNTAGIVDYRSDLAFAANYYDDSGKTAALLNVRYYPQQSVTQTEARNFTAADVRELDSVLRQEVPKGVALAGFQVVEWLGTSKQMIDASLVFISEYRRTSPNGFFRVRLARVIDAERSFTLTIAYREDQAYFLQPVSDYITRSLRR